MPRNPRVAKAFRAMRVLGIPEEQTKPVLKKLLKLYDKNWELIEEENYRALADAIFETEETEADEKKKRVENTEEWKEEAQPQEEPELPLKRLRSRHQDVQASPSFCNPDSNLVENSDVMEPECPLKRLRLRHQDVQASPSFCNPDPNLVETSLRRPKVEEAESCEMNHHHGSSKVTDVHQSNVENTRLESECVLAQPLTRNKGKQPVSPRAVAVLERSVPSQPEVMRRNGRTKEPVSPQIASREQKSFSRRSSRALPLKEPKVEPNIDVDPKESLPESQTLIKPKDEPFTDDMPQYAVPIAVIHPDSSSKQDSLIENNPVKEPHGAELLASQSADGEDKTDLSASSSEMRTNHELANIPDESPATLEVASSSCGEETINVTPTIDLLKKACPVDGLGGEGIPLLNGSIDICCETEVAPPQIPRLLPHCEPMDDGMRPDMGAGCNRGEANMLNGLQHTDSCSLAAVRQCQVAPDGIKSVNDVNDIAKGQEKVIISLVNDVNNERPPSFHYVPQNVIFQNAYVNFSLARIGDANCCSNCFGDCLSSSTPCACANETCGDFAYTSEGLVKEDFLKECISMNRDPQKHCLYYCKDCPLERSKNEDVLEPCKGHLVRKFIKECWYKCGCSKKCGNRVVQRGINCNLQVFMTPKGKGWGLRTLEDLPKGAFVCEYVGEVLTNAELYDRISRSPRGKEHSYPVLLDADWGSEGVLKDEEALCLDATYYGNVARFINHRCGDSNLVEIPVEVETPDHHYYHLAFFTTRKVEALEELTWDYGIDFDDHEHPVKAFQCRCGSKFCRNIKRSNKSRSAARRR